ncbi:MAG: ribose 5-phosphate isomerase B [Proteobacteria bacterium]|nr:ribose 5-phosphate isomerase B [Pseudomonadota bacterium]MBU1688913.1 ribose 5-phosphate isomerase B [Pseudomonadota bacterium]
MNVAIGCDHGGFPVKDIVISVLRDLGVAVDDHGCASADSVNYPDYARLVCQAVVDGKADRGILICGTGIGMSMAANRYPTIRAALCQDIFTARMSREHNDANVLCLGARVVGPGLMIEIVKEWILTDFAGGRHQTRIDMFSEIGAAR